MTAFALAPIRAFASAEGCRGLQPLVMTVAVTDPAATTAPAVLDRPVFDVCLTLHPAVAAAWESLGATARTDWCFELPATSPALAEVLGVVSARCLDAPAMGARSRTGRLLELAEDVPALVAVAAAAPPPGPSGPRVDIALIGRRVRLTVRCPTLSFAAVRIPGPGHRVAVTFDEARAVLVEARSARWATADRGTTPLFGSAALLADSAVRSRPVPSAPGLATVLVGPAAMADVLAAADASDAPPEVSAEAAAACSAHAPRRTVSALDALDAAGTLDGWAPLYVHDDVIAAALAADPPGLEVPGLSGYQNRFVSTYAEAPRGAVCALAPGLGKTVCAAAAFRQRGAGTRWRGVVLAPSAVLTQWSSEFTRWYGGTHVVVLRSAGALDAAMSALSGPRSACVLTTPALAHLLAARLGPGDLDDVCVDEAAWLKNQRSARSVAAWQLRAAATRGLALSGTPVSAGIDDLGALVSWAVGDPDLFEAVPLSQRGATWAAPGPDGFTVAEVCGATVFADSGPTPDGLGDIPDLDLKVVQLSPTAGDSAVTAALWELLDQRQCDLDRARTALRGAAPGSSDGRTCRRELAAARSRLTATMSFIRLAHSAPEVAATSSLTGADVVASRWGDGGAKLAWVSEHAADAVSAGATLLIFSDSDAASTACAALLEANGITAVLLTGAAGRGARDRAIDAFRAGEVRVAIVGPAAQLGVNLAQADTVIHLDCGAGGTLARLIQRCARAARLGSSTERVSVLVPVVAGTIDAAVTAPLIARLEERLAAGHAGPSDDVAVLPSELLASRS